VPEEQHTAVRLERGKHEQPLVSVGTEGEFFADHALSSLPALRAVRRAGRRERFLRRVVGELHGAFI